MSAIWHKEELYAVCPAIAKKECNGMLTGIGADAPCPHAVSHLHTEACFQRCQKHPSVNTCAIARKEPNWEI